MHNQWEEMLPFYAAGTLNKAETIRLENHLARCKECSRSLDDWRLIADAVRAEATSQLRDLPPLAPEVLRAAASARTGADRIQSEGFSSATAAYAPQPVRQRQPTQRVSGTWVMMAAAAFTVLLIGGILALMLLRGSQEREDRGVVLAPSATPTALPAEAAAASQTPFPQIIVIEPSETPTAPAQEVPSRVPPTSVAPPTVSAPTLFVPTNFPLPTSEIQAVAPDTVLNADAALAQIDAGSRTACTLQAAIPSGSVINLYARPRIDATVLTTISGGELLTGLAVSDNGWYQLQSASGYVGWAQQGLLSASGSCDSLPMVFAQSAMEAGATPTETTLPFPDTPTPEAPLQNEAGTQEVLPAATDSAPPISTG